MIITIGGRPGAGTTSVSKALAKRLGYNFYGAGEVRRGLAIKKGITLAELNEKAKHDVSSDKLVDDYMKYLGETKDNFVVDGLLAFHFIPRSIKVFFDADIKVRARRILERANFEELPSSLKEAVKLLRQREEMDLERCEKLYGVDPFDYNQFDLIFDTTKHTVDESTEHVYKFVMHKLKK